MVTTSNRQMKLHKKHWSAVLLAGVVAVGVLAWGSYSRDTFSFEATNMNAWVEGVLSEEFHRLVESGAPLQLERPAIHSDDATTFEIVVTGTMDHKVVTGTVITTTSMRYDMTHDTLYLVPRDSNCTLLDVGAPDRDRRRPANSAWPFRHPSGRRSIVHHCRSPQWVVVAS